MEQVKKNYAEVRKDFFAGKGVLSKNPLRNSIYHLVVSVGVLARMCVEAGLPHSEAYTISDIYIQKADETKDVEAVLDLIGQAQIDFAERMRKLRKTAGKYSLYVRHAIDYIYDHLHEPLKMEDLAKVEGLSPGYFSKLFAKEVGTTVKAYILQVKVRTGANMLGNLDYLISSPIAPLHSFALFTAIGVTISLILAITFIPAILLLKDYKKVQASRSKKHNLSEKLAKKLEHARRLRGGKSADEAQGDTLYQIYHFFCGSKPRLYLSIIAMVGISIVGLRLLHIDTALVNYFPKDCDMRQDMDYIDRQFAGTNSLYLNVKGPDKGSLTNPEILKAVDDLQGYMESEFSDVGKIVSFTDFIKRINQVWHVPATDSAETSQMIESTDFTGSTDSSQMIASTDDFGAFDDFADFGDFTTEATASATEDDFEALDDFSDFSEFDDFGTDTESTESENPTFDYSTWTDPNTAYAQALEQNITVEDAITMLNKAYIAAGGKTAKFEDIVDELQKQVNYNGSAYYEIPYDTEKYPVASREELAGVVQGYLTLLSGSLDRFVDDYMNPQIMRITVQLRNHSTQTTGEIIAAAQKFAEEHFPEGYTLEATGTAEMEHTMTKMIVSSQLTSLLISLLCVFVIIALAFKSGWAGLLGAVPLALAIILNYMVMGFAGINLDLVTSIIASVAVGVGIDYTIHFLSTYKEERTKSDDLEEVTRMTFRKSGHGIVTNAVAVGFGFLVLCFSKFVVLRYIGILVAIVMFTSSFLAMTVIPGFLNMYAPKFISKSNKK